MDGGSKRIAAYLDCSLLYPLRHPDFLRKSCSGGLPYGVLGRELISIGERGRVLVIIMIAEPGATHSQQCFSLYMGALRNRHKFGSRRPARWHGGTVVMVSAGSQHSAQYYLSLLTQARIPS